MNEVICPDCEKPIMSMEKAESLLRATESKILLGHCLCGVSYEIRSPIKNVLNVLTSSGKKSDQMIGEGEEP